MAAPGADSGGGGGGEGEEEEEKMVTLVSSDGARFEVREAAASLSQTVRRRMMDAAGGGGGGDGDGAIPLPDVGARTLSMVLEYCNKHAPVPAPAAAAHAEELEWFDREFVQVDMSTLCSLVVAADHLKVEGLLELARQAVADMIRRWSR